MADAASSLTRDDLSQPLRRIPRAAHELRPHPDQPLLDRAVSSLKRFCLEAYGVPPEVLFPCAPRMQHTTLWSPSGLAAHAEYERTIVVRPRARFNDDMLLVELKYPLLLHEAGHLVTGNPTLSRLRAPLGNALEEMLAEGLAHQVLLSEGWSLHQRQVGNRSMELSVLSPCRGVETGHYRALSQTSYDLAVCLFPRSHDPYREWIGLLLGAKLARSLRHVYEPLRRELGVDGALAVMSWGAYSYPHALLGSGDALRSVSQIVCRTLFSKTEASDGQQPSEQQTQDQRSEIRALRQRARVSEQNLHEDAQLVELLLESVESQSFYSASTALHSLRERGATPNDLALLIASRLACITPHLSRGELRAAVQHLSGGVELERMALRDAFLQGLPNLSRAVATYLESGDYELAHALATKYRIATWWAGMSLAVDRLVPSSGELTDQHIAALPSIARLIVSCGVRRAFRLKDGQLDQVQKMIRPRDTLYLNPAIVTVIDPASLKRLNLEEWFLGSCLRFRRTRSVELRLVED